MDRLKAYKYLVAEEPLIYIEGFFVAKIKVVYLRIFSYIHFVNKGVDNPII